MAGFFLVVVALTSIRSDGEVALKSGSSKKLVVASAPPRASKVNQMSSAFEGLLKAKSIDPRRLIAASQKIEKLRPEDRAIRLTKRLARKSEDGAKKKEGLKKARSGRPITQRSIAAAMTGKPLSGPIKTRMLRAVNHILEQKKQEQIALKVLFPGQPKNAS